MSVSGLCEICTTGEVEFTCPRCGSLVCEDHWDEDTGMCVECATELGSGDSHDHSEKPDGVDEYRF